MLEWIPITYQRQSTGGLLGESSGWSFPGISTDLIRNSPYKRHTISSQWTGEDLCSRAGDTLLRDKNIPNNHLCIWSTPDFHKLKIIMISNCKALVARSKKQNFVIHFARFCLSDFTLYSSIPTDNWYDNAPIKTQYMTATKLPWTI